MLVIPSEEEVFPGMARNLSKAGAATVPPTSVSNEFMTVALSAGVCVQKITAEPFWYFSRLSIQSTMLLMCCSTVSGVDGYLFTPSQIGDLGNASRSMRVTIPKLLLPPRRAIQRSAFSLAFALTISPLARTTSKFRTLSQTRPFS